MLGQRHIVALLTTLEVLNLGSELAYFLARSSAHPARHRLGEIVPPHLTVFVGDLGSNWGWWWRRCRRRGVLHRGDQICQVADLTVKLRHLGVVFALEGVEALPPALVLGLAHRGALIV